MSTKIVGSLVAVLLASASWAASKTEDDLRAQLAASEAARIALAKSLDKLAKSSDARSKQLTALATSGKIAAKEARAAADSAGVAANNASEAATQAKTDADAAAQKQEVATEKAAVISRWTPILLGIVAACAGVIGPVFMVWMQGRNRRNEKKVEYEREDAAEARAEKRDGVQSAKLCQIHTLVNSNLTAYMQDTLDTTRAYLALLLSTLTPSSEAHGIIVTTRAKVVELEAQLDDRKKQTDVAALKLKRKKIAAVQDHVRLEHEAAEKEAAELAALQTTDANSLEAEPEAVAAEPEPEVVLHRSVWQRFLDSF